MTKKEAAKYLRRCAQRCASNSVERLRFEEIAELLAPDEQYIRAAIAGVRAGLELDKPFAFHTWDGKACRWCGCSAHDMEPATKACPKRP